MADVPSSQASSPTEAEYFRLFIENVTDYALFGIDLHGRVATWNRGAERILGYAEAEILGAPASVVFTPEDQQAGAPEQELTQAREQGRADDERWHVRKDGSRFFASGVLTALRDEQQHLRGYVKVLRDTSQRKQVEETVRERETRLARKAHLLDLASESIFVHDLENRITFWNHAAEEMYGYTREEAVGQVCYELLQTHFPVSFATTRDHLMRSGHWEGELVHTRRDGSKLIVSSRWAVERDEEGQPTAFLESNRDITELKQTHEALLRDQRHIEALNARLQWAMTETHHRTKNNLQLLSAMMDMLLHDRGENVQIEDLQRILAFIRSMAAIHDILTYESRDYGQVQEVSSKEFLERLIALLSSTAGMNRNLYAHIQPARLSTKQATSLALIVNELVANALKHSSGDVEVAFEAQANVGHLRVCDQGRGFPPDFNLSTSANTGLELVEMLCRTDLGGQALYANREEGGACVTVTVPLA